RGGKNHKGKGKAQQTHIASSGIIPDAGSLPTPNIGSSQTVVAHTPSYTLPDLPAKTLLDRIKKNPQVASGVKPGKFGIWTSANQARTLAEHIGVTPTTKTLRQNELLIKKVGPFQPFQGLCFNNKRKTPEPDKISLGSETKQEPVDPEDMVDYGADFSDNGFVDYGDENDMQTVNGMMQVSSHIQKLQIANDRFQGTLRNLNDLPDGYDKLAHSISGSVFIGAYKFIHDHFAACTECGKSNKTNWILDSGASAHFTPDINDFVDYKLLENQGTVQTAAADQTISIIGVGTVQNW
ncbi:hypothetical protein H0H81_006137, partial [Sphagnurus paluster]